MQSTTIQNIWVTLLAVTVTIYLIYTIVAMIIKIAKDYSLMTKKISIFHKILRRYFYLVAIKELRYYIAQYCDKYSDHKGSTVRAIIMYEIDLNYYQDLFINQGYDRLFVETVTKLEEIYKFVIDWKKANAYLTSSEMLELYLNETKP